MTVLHANNKADAEDLGYFFGFLRGDGHIGKSPRIECKETEHLVKAKEVAERLLKIRCRMSSSSYNAAGRTYYQLHLQGGTSTIALLSGYTRNNKKVPTCPYFTDSFRHGYVAGMYDAEGCITISAKGDISFSISNGDMLLLRTMNSWMRGWGFTTKVALPYGEGTVARIIFYGRRIEQWHRFLQEFKTYLLRRRKTRLPRRSRAGKNNSSYKELDGKKIRYLYVTKKWSKERIAKELHTSNVTIGSRLKQMNIPERDFKRACALWSLATPRISMGRRGQH